MILESRKSRAHRPILKSSNIKSGSSDRIFRQRLHSKCDLWLLNSRSDNQVSPHARSLRDHVKTASIRAAFNNSFQLFHLS